MNGKANKGLEIVKSLVIGLLSVMLVINIFIIIQSKLNPNKIPSIFGYKPFIVLSNLMKDEIVVGDLAIVKSTNFDSLKTGDVIAFRDANDKVTTHRIVNTIERNYEICFETKGDNNETKDDGMVCENSIEGLYVFKIPYLGSLILFIQKPYGFIILLLILIILFLLMNSSGNKNSNLNKEDNEYNKEIKRKEFKRK